MSDSTNQRRLAAILAADVAGYTQLVEQDTDGTVAAWKEARDYVIKPVVTKKSGHVIRFTGDGFLVEFSSVQDAVACAITLQEQLKSNLLNFRMGIDVGDITDDGGDVHGEGVNIAARLEAMADPGGICVSGNVYHQVGNRIDAVFEDMGEQSVKHVSRPVQVFAVEFGQTSSSVRPPENVSDKTSIAVLPFDNMSNDPDQDYFSDGIAEDIITDLSKISTLFVIARNTSFKYKGNAIDVSQVANELGVQYVLEGSVRKSTNKIRVSAQLIDGSSGGHVWADRFDRELADIFAVQDEVTGNIVRELHLHLTPQEEKLIGSIGTTNIEAYDLRLRARRLRYQFTADSTVKARQLLEKALELDPNFGPAYTDIALTVNTQFLNGWNGVTKEDVSDGLQLVEKALELHPDDAQAHWGFSVISLFAKDFERAEIEINKSVKLDPNFAEAYATRGNFLGYTGRYDEAIENIEYAIRLDPEHPNIFLHFLAQAYYLKGDYIQATELLERRVRLNPNTDISRVLLAACYGNLERNDDRGGSVYLNS